METVLWPVPPGEAGDLSVERVVDGETITLTITRGDLQDVLVVGPGDTLSLQRFAADRLVIEVTQ